MSTKKRTAKHQATQGETRSILPGSREERAYRQVILGLVNALAAIPADVCTRWRDTIKRKLDRPHAGPVLTPVEARVFLFINAQTTARFMDRLTKPVSPPARRRATARTAA